jgi:hypothetical protein
MFWFEKTTTKERNIMNSTQQTGPILEQFEVASGSVTGRDHLRDLGWKNNQDAVATVFRNDCIIVVVADGCSAAEQSKASHNEVGAHLGCRIIAEAIASRSSYLSALHGQDFGIPIWEGVRLEVLASIQSLAKAMGGSFSQTIRDYFLFTVLGTIITPQKTFMFSIGDGVEILNGEHFPIGPFPGNMPPYLAYSLVQSSIDPAQCGFQIRRAWPTEEIQTIFIGTDGVHDLIKAEGKLLPGKNHPGKEMYVGPISQFWTDDAFFKNPDQVRRRLALVNNACHRQEKSGELVKFPGLLPDDTTLAVIRRKKGEKNAT